MTPENWLLSIIPTILLLLLAWFARHQFGSWLSPTAFFGVYWGLMLLAPLVIAPDYYFWPGAAWFILFCVWTLHIGMQLGWALGGQSNIRTTSGGPVAYRLHWGRQVLFLCFVLSLPATPIILQSRGYSIGALLSPTAIAQIAREFSVARYMANYTPPLIATILTSFAYLGAIFSGIWLATERPGWSRLFALLPFIPLGLQSLILTTRATLLIPVIFSIAGYCAAISLAGIGMKISRKIFITRSIIALVLSISIFIGLQMLRDALTVNQTDIAVGKTYVAALGSASIFSQWLERDGLSGHEPAWGAYNLAGIFDLLDIANRKQGVFTEFIQIGTSGSTSNIYTIFRGLIEDFTLPGSLLVFCIVGAGAGFAYRMIVKGLSIYIPILAIFYAFTLWSNVTSILNYNSIVLAWAIFTIALAPFGLFLLRSNIHPDNIMMTSMQMKEQFK